ncbi:MAG TPA: SRPBCC family protein [Acidimicrobiia bacterium]|nr:SRPBCC family protein [Acidimicrobiia bacterium]
MARYVTVMRTPQSPPDAFGYLADVEHFAEWDPGVARAVQVVGDGPGPGSAYDLDVRTGPRTTTFRYETVEWDPPRRLLLRAERGVFLSVDEIRVEPDGAGARVTYDARLTLRGPAALLDPLLRLAFGRIGDRAAAGLRRALHATPVAT